MPTFTVDILEPDKRGNPLIAVSDSGLAFELSGNMGPMPEHEDFWHTENGIWRPYINEISAVATVVVGEEDNTTLEESIEIDYVVADGHIYLKGWSNAIPAHSPISVIDNRTETVYRIEYLFGGITTDDDAILGIDGDEKQVYVTNLDTGVRVPKDYDEISELVGNDGPLQYALRVRDISF